jgi:hypothetical protein
MASKRKARYVRVDIAPELCSGNVLTARVYLDQGCIVVMAEVTVGTDHIRLDGFHLHGEGVWANDFGAGYLRVVADALMEEYDVGSLEIAGGARTTGAGPPGRIPGLLRFTRRRPDHASEP